MASFGKVALAVIFCLVSASSAAPSVPAVQVNGKPVLGNSIYIIPPSGMYTFNILVKNGSPLFVKDGSFLVYQDDDILLDPEIILEDSNEVVGANNLKTTFKMTMDKTTKMTFVTLHPAILNQRRETVIIFKVGQLDMNYVAFARPVGYPTLSIEFGDKSGFGLRDATYTWYEQKEGATNWLEMTNTKAKLDLKGKLRGNYTYKMSAVQERIFNVKAESHKIHLLMYEPLTNVSFKYPPPEDTRVSTKRGSPVTMECSAQGYPAPEFLWSKATENGLEVVSNSQTLTVGSDVSESGRYKCAAILPLFEQRVARVAKEVAYVTVE